MKIFDKIKYIHMVGIKGTGMSTLAVNLKHMGLRVTGSDYPESFFTDELLKKQRIKVMSPFAAKNVSPKTDAIVV
ncbi:MAG: Mur ligase domain-containing protein, partial [Candidatus Paceibacterota bacterium]